MSAATFDPGPPPGFGPPEQWRAAAACNGMNPDVFHPSGATKHTPDDDPMWALPRSVCSRCPVEDDCRRAAVANGETLGMWGRTTPRERRFQMDLVDGRERRRRAGLLPVMEGADDAG